MEGGKVEKPEEYEEETHKDYIQYTQMLSNLDRKIDEWGGSEREMFQDMRPYNLNPRLKDVVSSWLYEYAIFNLVKEYREFDWENDLLVYVGG